MGNQREMLKANIEKELVSKIEAAKSKIDQLNKNLEVSKQNALSVKEEIRVTSDAIKEVLVQRKKELIKEVETWHTAQARPINDAIKSTYVTMGRLQSMLANLDSFDQSQLVSLHIPPVDMTCTQNEPAQITADLECEKIKGDLKEWGSITDEFQCYMLEDLPDNLPFEEMKTAEIASNSSPGSVLIANKENSMSKGVSSAGPKQVSPWSSWGIENWLSRSVKKTTISNEDSSDFEIMSPNADQDMDFVVPDQDNNSNMVRDDGESNSSIVCIEKETFTPKQDDLSMWLKPKKAKSVQSGASLLCQKSDNVPAAEKENAPKPLSTDTTGKIKHTAVVRKRLEFPCLEWNSEKWHPKRKSSSSSSSVLSSNPYSKYQTAKLKSIPPTYVLPNPFWLKPRVRKN